MKNIMKFFSIALIPILIGCDSKFFCPPPVIVENKTEEYKVHRNWIQINNQEKIDEYSKVDDFIYCGSAGCGAKPMKNIDISSFVVFPGSGYAKDKNHVYYPLEIICYDGNCCGACTCSKYTIKDAISKSFQYLGKEYAKDKNHVYFRGVKIQNADAESFKILKSPEYCFFGKDKNHVFIHNTIMEEADSKTFEIKDTSQKYWKAIIIQDKFSKWEYTPPSTINKIDSI